MKKNVLFVVDEKKMGGVSILLTDILKNIEIDKYNIDILVLHNNGDNLNHLPKNVKIIYGTSFFKTVDLTLKQTIKSLNPLLIFSKLRLIYLMKSKRIGNRIVKEGIDDQGRALAVREKKWYAVIREKGFNNIPVIYETDPLIMERVDGRNVYE